MIVNLNEKDKERMERLKNRFDMENEEEIMKKCLKLAVWATTPSIERKGHDNPADVRFF